jgi:hypothetical protein
MKIDIPAVRACLKSFDFKTLFREHLGWDNHRAELDIPVDGTVIHLTAVAQKRGFVAFVCPSIPDRRTRLKVDHQITKSVREHFVIYADQTSGQQVWQWVRREQGKPLASRDHRFDTRQSGDSLIQRLEQIAVGLDEEEKITVVDVAGRARVAFDVDKITKKFYDRFKAEHAAFLKLVKGIKADADLQWYTSLMLNRLMFVYFIQKKGFLDGDTDYLRNRLAMVSREKGKDKFQSFYRYFLLRLFHEGLGRSPDERKLDPVMEKLLGKVPYLNGGFFEVHQLEEQNPELDIPDKAFEKLFDFFDQYSWHLDERPLRADNEINPDVVGYIFEKYVNQKQMGAYYTKEDITEYISKNTLIPFLCDAAQKKCAVAFNPDSALWRLLRDDPDRYIYPAVRHGVVDEKGDVIPLPSDIEAGVNEVSKRDGWNRPAPDPYALPTETWREHVARRQRCLDIREKLDKGQVHQTNDLITFNLDIWQFTRDAIINAEGPELLRAFWHAIEEVTILDPACGSGAFLFAALRILETLYSDCMERMERFIEDIADKPHHPEQYSDFKKVLARIGQHPNDRYFILKSIIINNLFGVDIMEEAVEICKLRLFLKLVAQVEAVQQIEPLPDIDFNIRGGNTLVGYATLDQARKAFTTGAEGQGKLMLGDTAEAFKRFEESVELVDKAFQQFRAQQTTYGGKVTHGDKRELRKRLAKLDDELDRYLAGEYGVNVERQKDFEAWKTNYQPFHWFVEFYGIMHAGGFDVIIGNPPYVERRIVRRQYDVLGYSTETTNNLYAYVSERAETLLFSNGRFGLIVPLSSMSTDKFAPLQKQVMAQRAVWLSNFDDRPSRLFDGLEHIQLTIILYARGQTGSQTDLHTTRCVKWSAAERDTLFPLLSYASEDRLYMPDSVPKVGSDLEVSILDKLWRIGSCVEYALSGTGKATVYYTRKVHAFLNILDFVPDIRDGHGRKRQPSEQKTLTFTEVGTADVALCVLNSTLFRWFLATFSDCRNLNRREVLAFKVDLSGLFAHHGKAMSMLARELSKHLKDTSEVRQMSFGEEKLKVQCIIPRHSKYIIDEIDRVLARHYGFSDEELDFIINYDIKYRMGQEEQGEQEQ